jgi:hypothetical protein
MLGNPFIQPWKDLAALVSEANGQRGESIVREDFAMEQFLFGSWYVCWGSKPLRDPIAAYPLEAEQLIAAE